MKDGIAFQFVTYWCGKCEAHITPKRGIFDHPDIGPATAWFCPAHRIMVDIRIIERHSEDMA